MSTSGDAPHQSFDASTNYHPLKRGDAEQNDCNDPRERVKANFRHPPKEKPPAKQEQGSENTKQSNGNEVQGGHRAEKPRRVTIEKHTISDWDSVTPATGIPRVWIRPRQCVDGVDDQNQMNDEEELCEATANYKFHNPGD